MTYHENTGTYRTRWKRGCTCTYQPIPVKAITIARVAYARYSETTLQLLATTSTMPLLDDTTSLLHTSTTQTAAISAGCISCAEPTGSPEYQMHTKTQEQCMLAATNRTLLEENEQLKQELALLGQGPLEPPLQSAHHTNQQALQTLLSETNRAILQGNADILLAIQRQQQLILPVPAPSSPLPLYSTSVQTQTDEVPASDSEELISAAALLVQRVAQFQPMLLKFCSRPPP